MRNDMPDKKEFSGKFPRRMYVFAAVGISGEEWADVHWRVARFFHLGEKYDVGFEGGTNEHGVEYELIAWLPIPQISEALDFAKEKQREK